MKIGGQWCQIIHNDQRPVCSECRQEGHTRGRCPDIECRRCKNKGHMSYDCDKAYLNELEENQGAEASVPNDMSYHGEKNLTLYIKYKESHLAVLSTSVVGISRVRP